MTEPAIRVRALDHLVLTVADVEATIEWYVRVCGMQHSMFGTGRQALRFGDSKINLHVKGSEYAPHSAAPTVGSADICLVVDAPSDQVVRHLADLGVEIVDGPVPRTGARGLVISVYVRDPDGNLVELASYDS